MAPKASAASEDSSSILSASSNTSSSYANAGLELSSSSHSIAKHNLKKKGPIIRVVHVFAPKLIKTDAANFRTLVQKLTGNRTSNEDDEQEEAAAAAAKENSRHNHGQAINHVKELELRYQKEREASIPAYSCATSSSSAAHNTQLEEDYEHPLLRYGFLQAGLTSNHTELATRVQESIGYIPGLARIEERDGRFPANQGGLGRNNEGTHCFPTNNCYDDAYDHSSPSSLDNSSSSTRGSSLNYEMENNPSVFSDELMDLMGGFNSSYPFINVDDQHLPQLLMSALDTKLEFSLLNPSW